MTSNLPDLLRVWKEVGHGDDASSKSIFAQIIRLALEGEVVPACDLAEAMDADEHTLRQWLLGERQPPELTQNEAVRWISHFVTEAA